MLDFAGAFDRSRRHARFKLWIIHYVNHSILHPEDEHAGIKLFVFHFSSDFEKSLSMSVMADNQSYNLPASSAYNLSVIFKNKGDNEKATYYTEQAKQLGYKF